MRESAHPPFEFAVVDEAQDVSVPQLRFLAALGAGRPNSLFFAGDLGQRIFQQPFSWKALGVDVRGRSSTLRINYRTSHQIRTQADRLLGPEVSDVDGNKEDRKGTISTFNGPPPDIMVLDTPEEEIKAVSQWLAARTKEGIVPHEIGVFVRSAAELDRARAAVESAKLPYKVLDDNVETTSGQASISTMHLAKGLEFRTVVVMACDDEVIPLQERIETVADDADLEEVYNTERHLLYVACTRARDHLLVTGVEPASEFSGRPAKLRFRIAWYGPHRMLLPAYVPMFHRQPAKPAGQALGLRHRSRTVCPRCAPARRDGSSYQSATLAQQARLFARCLFKRHWGDSGGTLASTDGEIRVRMGNSQFWPPPRHTRTPGMFCRGYVETKDLNWLLG